MIARDGKIARYAAGLVEPNDFVYLDAGTTTELMIDYLTEKDITFVTNAVSHARKLSMAGYTTYILGGEFKATTEAIVGDEAIESLQKYNFTKSDTNNANVENAFVELQNAYKSLGIKGKSLKPIKDEEVIIAYLDPFYPEVEEKMK